QYTDERFHAVSGDAKISALESSATLWSARIKCMTDSLVQASVLYFPGWTTTIDGMKVPEKIAAATGDIQFRVPAGDHRVELMLKKTPPRFYGELISLVTLLSATGLGLRKLRIANRSSVGLVIAIAAISTVPLWLTTAVPTPDRPTHLYNAWVMTRLNDPTMAS